MRHNKLLSLYIVLMIAMLYIEWNNLIDARNIIKPILMPILILTIYTKMTNTWQRNLLGLALLLSCIGDVLLLHPEKATNFMLGLVAFLLGHITYIIIFTKDIKLQKSHKFVAGFSLLVIIFVITFYTSIKNNLGDMQIPVLAYMIIISIMSIIAAFRKNSVNNASFLWVFCGAILFMISDSMLAIDKFVVQFAHSSVFIMLSYMLAQLFIIIGILRQK